jgi:precorrin-6A/cobalt-precorrin-6A reductase
MRILLLGGTGEARALAARLHPEYDIVSSLAGRVPDPALPAGPVRIGGFGGMDGLRQWLRDNDIGAVVDATHPFASTMTAHAAQVCGELELPHLVLSRPAWDPSGAIRVGSDVEAAQVVADQHYSRVFLTTGRSGVRPFMSSAAWFLIRVVTPPDSDLLPCNHELLLSRGPYGYADECALLRDNRIDVLVTKNSGGELTEAKLKAANDCGIAIVMIDRPPLPDGVTVVGTVDEAVDWVAGLEQ